MHRLHAATVIAALVAAAPLHAQSTQADQLALGRKYAEWFFTGQTDSLWANLNPEFRSNLKGPEELLARRDELAGRGGNEVKVLEEKMTRRQGKAQYWRESTYDVFTGEPIVFRVLLDENGKVAGFGVNPKSEAPPVDP